ncbi:phage tail sheath C-terminal domain-containing protein [Streptomyces sp. NEAU-YJ-81]|uniref:phage tail sheath C-terminal domain-containing protein n=1 Tax=Streptomyces sp. NEAU-YJ-81 TaxID=2820288 RepID=UPI001ABBF3E3|nr:phage tail sheath C-terminal domain-containing protein [Streptomyces sp. NEAU-YJ-81]MBO3679347.1 phage tail sheath subtilisin-like domain-containing protein [Streptomyces sp. NEAU-YJ-81]
MAEYLSPGVYIEEIDAGPRPIAGVSTSTAGMAGVTVRGPYTGKPKLVTNFLEFQNTFGGFLRGPDPLIRDTWANDPAEGGRWWLFPLAVKGFFDNGGQRLYIKRVASRQASPSSGVLGHGLVSPVAGDAAKGATRLELGHLIGFSGVGQQIQLFRGDDQQSIHTAGVAAYDATTRRIELDAQLPAEVRAGRGDYVQIGTRNAEETLEFAAVSPGSWGDAVQVRIQPMASAALPVLPDPQEGPLFVTRLAADAAADSETVEVAAVTGLDPDELPPDVWVQIGSSRFKVQLSQPADGKVTLTLPSGTAHEAWRSGLLVRRVRRGTTSAGPTLRIGGASRLYEGAVVQLDDGTQLTIRTVESIAADVVTLDGNVPGTLFETDRLQLVEAQVDARFTDPSGAVETETHRNLRLTGDTAANLVTALAVRSRLVRATALGALSTDPAKFPLPAVGSWLTLGGGDDAYGSLSVADFVGEDGGSGKRTGITALEDIDEVAVCAVPGMWSGTVESALVTHCELLRDRFAILDPQDGLDIEGVQAFRERFDTKYAALYHPWLVTRDLSAGRDVEVPPSGHMAGIYARVDVERGVHKAPANTVIRGIRLTDGIAQDITKRHQDVLNPKGINALRFFPGLGHRVWGARTLSSDSSWKYVNVRRLFLYLEESIEEGTQWVVFEPNDEALWSLVRQTVTNFLTTVWRSGALAGTTADEAFFVACDRTTMTEDDLANGRLICAIGVAPVFPAEFVIFRIQQKTRETQLA